MRGRAPRPSLTGSSLSGFDRCPSLETARCSMNCGVCHPKQSAQHRSSTEGEAGMRRNILCALLAALIGQSAAFQPLVSRSLAHAPSLRHGILGSAPARPHFANIRGKQARGLAELRAQVEVASAIAPALNAIASGLTSVSGAAALCAVIAFHEAGHFLAARVQVVQRPVLRADRSLRCILTLNISLQSVNYLCHMARSKSVH